MTLGSGHTISDGQLGTDVEIERNLNAAGFIA